MSKALQWEREISGVLGASGTVPGGLTVKRAPDFRDSGLYDLRDAAGVVVARVFRDPGDRGWYEEDLPDAPQTHYAERWRGSTRAEAVASIARRLGLQPHRSSIIP